MTVYRNKEGKKLYPVCSWEENQHKLYNAHDRTLIRRYDLYMEGGTEEEYDAIEKEVERIEHALNVFDGIVINGIVYATYEDSVIIKDYVWAYNARH